MYLEYILLFLGKKLQSLWIFTRWIHLRFQNDLGRCTSPQKINSVQLFLIQWSFLKPLFFEFWFQPQPLTPPPITNLHGSCNVAENNLSLWFVILQGDNNVGSNEFHANAMASSSKVYKLRFIYMVAETLDHLYKRNSVQFK